MSALDTINKFKASFLERTGAEPTAMEVAHGLKFQIAQPRTRSLALEAACQFHERYRAVEGVGEFNTAMVNRRCIKALVEMTT